MKTNPNLWLSKRTILLKLMEKKNMLITGNKIMTMINLKTIVEFIHLEMPIKEHKKGNHNLVYLICLRKDKSMTTLTKKTITKNKTKS